MGIVLALALCYLLGSLPTAYVLVKWIKRVDIRTVGSGNVGATNALRIAGPWAGAAVLVVDMLKGVVAATLLPQLLVQTPSSTTRLACGLAAVVGHMASCFLKFQGGKGVATTIGALLGAAPTVAGIAVAVWLIVFGLFRYVSLGSVVAAATIPIAQAAQRASLGDVLLGASLAILIIGRHRTNLQRLLAGAEHRWTRRAH